MTIPANVHYRLQSVAQALTMLNLRLAYLRRQGWKVELRVGSLAALDKDRRQVDLPAIKVYVGDTWVMHELACDAGFSHDQSDGEVWEAPPIDAMTSKLSVIYTDRHDKQLVNTVGV